MYNKKVLIDSLKKLGSAKAPTKKPDIIYEPKGQLKYPGQNTRIPSGDITMQGVPYPVLGKPNIGQPQMMQPGQNYQFPGADYVDEYPQMKKGGRTKGLVSMPKPSKKGLLSKGYSRSLDATNKFFTQNYLFAKPKSRKNKVFDPNSKYYAEGGESECPMFYKRDPISGECIPFTETEKSEYGTQYMKDWVQSPMYNEMLNASVAKDITTGDKDRVLNDEEKVLLDKYVNKYSKNITDLRLKATNPKVSILESDNDNLPLGEAYPYQLKDSIYFDDPSTLKLVNYQFADYDNPKNIDKNLQAEVNYYTENYPGEHAYVYAHEPSHLQDMGGSLIPQSDITMMEDYAFTPEIQAVYQNMRKEINDIIAKEPFDEQAKELYLDEQDIIYKKYYPQFHKRYNQDKELYEKDFNKYKVQNVPKQLTDIWNTLDNTLPYDEFIKKYKRFGDPVNKHKYISNVSETRARLNAIRMYGQASGIYNPFEEKLSPKKYKELQNLFYQQNPNDSDSNQLRQLREVYTDEEIFNLLNSISKNEPQQIDELKTPQAKQGGALDKFVGGGQGLVHAQDGINTDAMNGMMKARLAYANEFGNPAAERMINLPDNPYQFDNGDTGTHYMASYDNYAVPQIQDENGVLQLGDYGPESNEAIRFDSDEDANYFAENYKNVSPGFINEKKEGGESGCPLGYYWDGKKCVKAVSKQPTYSDSLFLYNNSLGLDKWMKQNKYSWLNLEKYNSNKWNSGNLYDYLKKTHEDDLKTGQRTRPLSKHVKKVGNFIGTSDWIGGAFDDYGIPFTWKHPNIKPQQEGDMRSANGSKKPWSYSFRYDPIAIKPSKLLTDAEIIKRYKKYGKSGISESRLKKLGLLKDNSTVLPTTRTVYIDCPPGSVSNGQKTEVITNDPDSPGNYLRTITTGCKPEEILNLPLLKPGLIDTTKYQIQGNTLNEEELELPNEEVESEYLEEGSPDTLNPMEWVNKKKYNIDWNGTSIAYRLPRFRKSGSYGGGLIRPGKKRYFHLPTIESRKIAYLRPKKQVNLWQDGGLHKFVGGGLQNISPCQADEYWDGEKCVKRTINYYNADEDLTKNSEYQDWLIRQSLWQYSDLPYNKQRDLYDKIITETVNYNNQQPYDFQGQVSNFYETYPETEDFEKNVNIGPYGSKTKFIESLTNDEAAKHSYRLISDDNQMVNKDAYNYTSYYKPFDKSNAFFQKYPPSSWSYHGKLSSRPTIENFSGNWNNNNFIYRKPNTSLIEDEVNRTYLKKIYPELTDEQIDKWVKDDQENPSYVTNEFDANRHRKWVSGQDAEGNDIAKGRDIFKDKEDLTGYKADKIEAYITQYDAYTPSWAEPKDLWLKKEEERLKLPILKPDLIEQEDSELQGFDADAYNEALENLEAPSYEPVESYNEHFGRTGSLKHKYDIFIPDKPFKMDLGPGGIRYGKSYGIPKFGMKASTMKDPITGETVNKQFRKDRKIQRETGLDRAYYEGSYDEEGNDIPGEIENAETEGRRINFEGQYGRKDRKAQEKYNLEYDEYEFRKKFPTLLDELNITYEDYINQNVPKKQYGGLHKFVGDGEKVYMYPERKDTYYKQNSNGTYLIKNKETGWKYTPIKDPTGSRTKLLNKNRVVFNKPQISTKKPNTNFLNKAIADNITAYGFWSGGNDYVAPNKELAAINNKYKRLNEEADKKYNHVQRTSKEQPRVEVPKELKEIYIKNRKEYVKEISKIAYNIKTGKKIKFPKYNNLNTYSKRVDNYYEGNLTYFPSLRPDNINASQDALSIHQGQPQKYNSFKLSKYKPTRTKNDNVKNYEFMGDAKQELEDDLFKYGNSDFINSKETFRQVKNSHVAQAALKDFQYSKGKDDRGKYVAYYDKNNYGNILDMIPNSKTFDIYGRVYYKDYGNGINKKMYYSNKELSELNANKSNFNTLALQKELSNRGYKLPKSTTKEGTFDGIYGDETKNALLDYQNKNKKQESFLNEKQYGGISDDYIEVDLNEDEIKKYVNGGYVVEELDNYQDGGTTDPPPPWNPDYPINFYEFESLSPEERASRDKRSNYVQALTNEPEYADEGLEFVKGWHDSPMYNQMVLNSYNGQQKNADYLTKLRKKNIADIPPINIMNEPHPDDKNIQGESDSLTGQVTVFPTGFEEPGLYVHEYTHSSDRPRELYKYDHPSYIFQSSENPLHYEFRVPSWMYYEDPRFPDEPSVNHGRLMPKSDQMYISTHRGANWKDNERYKTFNAAGTYTARTDDKIKKDMIENGLDPNESDFNSIFEMIKKEEKNNIKQYKKEDQESWQEYGHKYVSDPTEVRARLATIRMNAKKKGIYDPYIEQITPEIFENYINKQLEDEDYKALEPIDELRYEFTDEEILHMLRTISQNKNDSKTENEFDMQYSQYGGVADYQLGDEVDEDTMKTLKKLGYTFNKI